MRIVTGSWPAWGSAIVLALLLASCARRQADVSPSSTAWGTPAPPVERGTPEASPPAGPMTITIEDAVLMALESNRALSVERLNPPIERTFEQQERAAFDPVVSADVSFDEATTGDRATSSGLESRSGRERSTGGSAAVSELLPTGTTIDLSMTTGPTTSSATAAGDQTTRAALTVTQALLQGRGAGVNLANLRQARFDTQLSEYELRGFAEALVAEVENTYWNYVLARRQVEILDESLDLAQQQFDETQKRVNVGDLAETELAAAEAEVALRREALINARSTVDKLTARLVRLIRPSALPSTDRQVTPQSEPAISAAPLEPVEEHVAVALQMRPDLNQARLLVERGNLGLVKTKNGLLPRMDLFISLGKTGYADSFGRSVNDLGEDDDVSVGLLFDYALGNRAAEARHQNAVLTQQQLDASLRAVEDLVREDVELAYIEVKRAREQVDATATTRKFQEEKLRAEMARFRVGKSTALLVALAQRDLVESQVSEIAAIANYLKARTDLFLKEGSLLERRGLSAPGRRPVPSGGNE